VCSSLLGGCEKSQTGQLVFPNVARNQIITAFLRLRLSVTRENVFDEFAAQRVDRRLRILQQIDVKTSREWVPARVCETAHLEAQATKEPIKWGLRHFLRQALSR
jgi:hypothetical protein